MEAFYSKHVPNMVLDQIDQLQIHFLIYRSKPYFQYFPYKQLWKLNFGKACNRKNIDVGKKETQTHQFLLFPKPILYS